MDYLGSIEVVEDSSLHSVCFGDICALDESMEDMECSFFCVSPEDHITQIRIFQKTVKEVCLCRTECNRAMGAMQSGVTSGSVIVIRPIEEDEVVNVDKLRRELQSVRSTPHEDMMWAMASIKIIAI